MSEALAYGVAQLAWRSFRAGSVGVGAVVVGPDGRVVATAENRMHLAGSAGVRDSAHLAHAELRALSTLPWALPTRNQLTVWTSLDPCPMCAAAIKFMGLKNPVSLAKDPKYPSSDLDAALVDGTEAMRVFCSLLPILWYTWNSPAGGLVARLVENGNGQLLGAITDAWMSGEIDRIRSTYSIWELAAPAILRAVDPNHIAREQILRGL